MQTIPKLSLDEEGKRMKTVYIVVMHDYEGDDIEGVFDDKQLADDFAKKLGSDYCVDEYQLNPKITVTYDYNVCLTKDGTVLRTWCLESPNIRKEDAREHIYFSTEVIKVPTYKQNYREEKIPVMHYTIPMTLKSDPELMEMAVKCAKNVLEEINKANKWDNAAFFLNFIQKKVKP